MFGPSRPVDLTEDNAIVRKRLNLLNKKKSILEMKTGSAKKLLKYGSTEPTVPQTVRAYPPDFNRFSVSQRGSGIRIVKDTPAKPIEVGRNAYERADRDGFFF